MSRHHVTILDVDGVVADFIHAYTTMAAAMFPGRVVPQSTGERKMWEEMDQDYDKILWERILRSDRWWTDLEPLATPLDFAMINALSVVGDVYFVTARAGDTAKAQTTAWLAKHGVRSPTVVISSRKGEVAAALGCTHFIDDKAGNSVAVSYMSRGTRSYLLDRQYNRLDHRVIGGKVKRVSTLGAFLEDVSLYATDRA